MTCDAAFSLPISVFNPIISIFYGLSAISAALGNTFSLVVLWQPSQRSKSNKILTSLAVSDCLVGYICNPMVIWLINNSYELTSLVCRVYTAGLFVATWVVGCSAFTIIFIAYDRYTNITKPFQYHDIITDRKINIILISIWGGLAASSLLCALNKIFYIVFISIGFVITTAILIAGYYYIWKAVKQSQTNIACLSGNDQENMRTGIRLAKKVLIIVIVYFIAFLPISVYSIMAFLSKDWNRSYRAYISIIGILFGISNSSVNPFIYIWKDLEFRRACKRILRRNRVTAIIRHSTIKEVTNSQRLKSINFHRTSNAK